MKTPQQILIAAAELIERNGKAEDVYIDIPAVVTDGTLIALDEDPARCRMCVMGAIGFVASGSLNGPRSQYSHEPTPDEAAGTAAVQLLKDVVGPHIIDWSDGNSAATVVWGLRHAAGVEPS